MIFSVTEIESFLRCPRKAYLTSKNGRHLGPMFGPLNLSVGSLVHRAQQLWLEHPEKTLREHCLTASVEMQHGIITRYKAQVGVMPSDDELGTLYDSVQFAVAMCVNYEQHYHTPLPPEHRLIGAEQRIRIRVPGTDHYIEGRLDGLLQFIPTGQLRILERKTYDRRPTYENLRSNFQFMGYDFLVRSLEVNAELGVCVAYDGLWRRESPPKGRKFEDLFARYLLPERNAHERAEFAKHLPKWVNDMAALYANPEELAYPIRPWSGCMGCTMDGRESQGVPSLCYAMSRGQNTDEIVRLNYVERTDDVEEENSDGNGA